MSETRTAISDQGDEAVIDTPAVCPACGAPGLWFHSADKWDHDCPSCDHAEVRQA